MDNLSSLWIVGVVALLIGAVIGLLIARSSAGGRSRESLIEELSDTRRELDEYKQEVGAHFAQTADLVNRLTDSYRDVHQHLSKSAQKLCDDETLVASLMAREQQPVLSAPTEPTPEDKPTDNVEAPKDYAPKLPDQEGILSEQYGLKSKQTGHSDKDEPAPFDPTQVADHAPEDHSDDGDKPKPRD